MEIIAFTLVAILLYLISDGLLNRIEALLGHRLPHRSLVFFVILLVTALLTFAWIRRLTD